MREGELSFHADARELTGHVFAPGGGQSSGAGILFVHGSESNEEGYRPRAAAAAERLGATCLTFNLSGHGQDGEASYSIRDNLDDCIAAFDTLRQLPGVGAGRIGICGASYGAYLAALLLSQRTIASVLLRAPALYADDEIDSPGGPAGSRSETVETATALANVARYDGPILLVESEHDETIPREAIEAYASVARKMTSMVIPDAGHALDSERARAQFIEIIVDWFGLTLSQAGAG
jgi:uncharacterized protein